MSNGNRKSELYKAKTEEYDFEIVEDLRSASWYLIVYKDGKDLYDHHQDTLDQCKSQASEEFGVPYSIWEKQ